MVSEPVRHDGYKVGSVIRGSHGVTSDEALALALTQPGRLASGAVPWVERPWVKRSLRYGGTSPQELGKGPMLQHGIRAMVSLKESKVENDYGIYMKFWKF